VDQKEAPLTVDALHQYTYCPRRAYLMHAEGLMAHNAHTEDGKFVHRRVDRFSHPLDRPSEPDASADSHGEEPPKVVTSVTLESEQLGLVGKLDLVSTDGGEAVPVETKRGNVPSNAQGAWEPERVQLMAQGLLLRANGWRCDHGYLYYAGSRRRVRVSFDAQLEARTLDLLHAARAQLLDTSIPDPLNDSPKCHGCSVAGICLPDETLALRQVPRDALAPSVRRLYPSRPDASLTLPSFPGSLNRVFTRPAFVGRQAMPVQTASG
jgi:CRISPR-associated protein Cas1